MDNKHIGALNDDGIIDPYPATKVDVPDNATVLDPYTVINPLEGSVFINGSNSYSGADIKVVCHIYDGGFAAEEQKNILIQDLTQQRSKLQALYSRQTVLENKVDLTSAQIDELNKVTTGIAYLSNTMESMEEEVGRLSALHPRYSTKVLAEIQTLSVQTHREKFPVRGLGTTYVKNYTRGPRTIAGSMIFTVFDRHVLEEFLQAHPSDFDSHKGQTSALLDQVSPFDITVQFANELGSVSRMVIYGVEFINEGQTMSIEDMLLENVVQWVARDIDPMRSVGKRKLDEKSRLTQELVPIKASHLLNDKNYAEYRKQLSPFERFKTRRTPFT